MKKNVLGEVFVERAEFANVASKFNHRNKCISALSSYLLLELRASMSYKPRHHLLDPMSCLNISCYSLKYLYFCEFTSSPDNSSLQIGPRNREIISFSDNCSLQKPLRDARDVQLFPLIRTRLMRDRRLKNFLTKLFEVDMLLLQNKFPMLLF